MTIRINDELHAALHSLAYQMHVSMQTLIIQGIQQIVDEGDADSDNPDVSLVGKRVILRQGHPWAGHAGIVADSDSTSKVIVFLDIGRRCYATQSELDIYG